MIVNYRERKSVIRLYKVLIPVAFLVLCICPSWSNMSGNSIASSVPNEIIDTNNEDVQQLVDPINTFDYEGNDYLKRDAIEEINDLIDSYYKAELMIDMDTLEGLVSDIEQVNISKLQAQLAYIESIDNIICYTIAGDVEGTYRVYVYYDMKLRGIETPAPALSALYVTMSSDGSYIVYLSELDSETQDFIIESDESEEVLILKALVEERFLSVVESDETLNAFVAMLQENSSAAPAPQEPVAEEPVAEEPVAEQPVAEPPVAEEPVAEQPVAEPPVAEEPVADQPVAEQPVAEQPAEEALPE